MTLYAFGSNSSGQLGLGHNEDIINPGKCIGIGENEQVIKVSGGGNHSAVLLSTGRVLLSGVGQQGEARQNEMEKNPLLVPDLWYHYHEPDAFREHQWSDVACGWTFTLLVSQEGRVYGYGTAKFGEMGTSNTSSFMGLVEIHSQIQSIISVACGWRHVVALDASGSVYGWGWGRHGQLGEISPEYTLKKDVRIPSKMGTKEKIVQIACGHVHTLFLGHSGCVYGFGSDKYGQLGMENTDKCNVCVSRISAVSISAGWHHSAALDKNGNLFMWGRKDHHQLQHGLSNINQIVCGSEHTLARQGDNVIAWGWNEHGNCTSEADIVIDPVQVIKGHANVSGAGCASSWIDIGRV
ncbi:regulator of chromosome condensation 1/beta-lactamase-inhibitor protein II [Spinellus fusiger]|nr:regulator of chromosome condensation 1/beta-lactamase-inhibitor protein II [Spinellus fusiger]